MSRGTGRALWLAVAALAGLWVVGILAMAWLPQRPDGDLTAIALFTAQHGDASWHTLRDALWLNAAGAGLIGMALAVLLLGAGAPLARQLLWVALLLWASGWLWNQTRGWQGELYLEPEVETPLGVDGKPTVTFERFLLPPAPSGPGRALHLRMRVDGSPHEIDRAHPFRAGGWRITPQWYGAIVSAPALASPLFFGESGTQVGMLRSGEAVRVTLDLTTLALDTEPRLPEAEAQHYAILSARFAPAAWTQWLGAGVGLVAFLLALGSWWIKRRTEGDEDGEL